MLLQLLPILHEALLAKVRERVAQALLQFGNQEGKVLGEALAAEVAQGELKIDDIDEAGLSAKLQTAGCPDPDLLIRTGGEQRISNFLLWQAA